MSRSGFTFIEVVSLLLVVSLGLLGAVGLVAYGMTLASRSQAAATGLATAVAVAADPTPLLDPQVAAGWTYVPYDVDGSGVLTSTAKGFINGYYVVRTETSTDDDISAAGTAPRAVYTRSARVDVDVYETINGAVAASFTTRIVRQRGRP